MSVGCKSTWIAVVLGVAAGGVLTALVGCGGSSGSGETRGAAFQGGRPIQAVCTTGMVADVVRNVGGSHVEVTQLMGEGVDPHLFQAGPEHVSRMAGADVVFYSGLHLEGKLDEIFKRMAARKPTVAIAEGIDESKLLEAEAGYHDPHVWFDVALWAETVDAVEGAMVKFDPPHAEDYRAAAKSYREKLSELDVWAKQETAKIPQADRVLVTAHDAFEYFARAYGFEVESIQGVNTVDEVATKRINELVNFIVERKIKAVFVESSVPPKRVQSLVEGCESRGWDVEIGGELYSDAMGKPGTEEGTYEGMVRANIRTIVDALK